MNERARATTPPPVQVRIGCENGRGHRGGRAAALGRSGRLALVVVVAHFDEKTFNKQDQIFCFNSEREGESVQTSAEKLSAPSFVQYEANFWR